MAALFLLPPSTVGIMQHGTSSRTSVQLCALPSSRPNAAFSHRSVSSYSGEGCRASQAAMLDAATASCSPQCSSMPARSSRLNVVCMAHPRRVAKVASTIHREISKLLLFDEVLVRAVTPERSGGSTELSAVLSVTDVYVSNDLQVVKVYVSIYSDERGKQQAMNNLQRLEPYVRRVMGQRVPLRLTPEYRFEYDDSLEEAELVERVIGAEEVARYRSELDQEGAQQRQQEDEQDPWKAAAAAAARPGTSTGAAPAADDDEGFFAADEVAPREQQQAPLKATAAPAGSQAAVPPAAKAKKAKRSTMSSTDVMGKPGPFDAWFGGAAGGSQKATFRRPVQQQQQQQQQGSGTAKADSQQTTGKQ